MAKRTVHHKKKPQVHVGRATKKRQRVDTNVQLINIIAREEIIADGYVDGEFKPSFAHLTDCYPNLDWKPKAEAVENPSPEFEFSDFEYGEILYKKDEKGNFIPVAKQAGSRIMFDIHLRLEFLVSGEIVEFLDLLILADESADIQHIKMALASDLDKIENVLDPDFIGHDPEWVAETSKFVHALVDNEELDDPKTRHMPRKLRSNRIYGIFLTSAVQEVVETAIGEVGEEVQNDSI